MTIFEEYSKYHGELFKQIIIFNNFKNVMEIGVAEGTTTKYLCEAVNITGGFVNGFDVWSAHGKWSQFPALSSKKKVELYLKEYSNFKMVQIDTRGSEFKDIISSLGELEFVFIDGDHSYDGVKNDFDVVYPLMSKNGVIAFHDTLRIDGCREFIIDLRTKYNDGTFDIVDFPWGNGDRRVGISLLVKRTYPILNIEIDERCGSPSSYNGIYKKEQKWYENEIRRNEENNIS